MRLRTWVRTRAVGGVTYTTQRVRIRTRVRIAQVGCVNASARCAVYAAGAYAYIHPRRGGANNTQVRAFMDYASQLGASIHSRFDVSTCFDVRV